MLLPSVSQNKKPNGIALSSPEYRSLDKPEVTAVSHWMICQLEFESCLNLGVVGVGGKGAKLSKSTAWNPAVGHRGVFAQLGTELIIHEKDV